MRKKKHLLIGIAIGALARPVIVRAYRPFRSRVRRKIYDVAFEYLQNFDADHPTT
jgi:hypothetical protein